MLTFTNDSLPNMHLELSPKGYYVRVTLNITEELSKVMAENNVHKADVHWVYSIKKRLDVLTEGKIKDAYNELLRTAMIRRREALNIINNKQKNEIKTKTFII